MHVALAVMFVFTAAAHFTRTRADLVRMVPLRLGNPGFRVTLTGLLELAGAAGLMIPQLARLAAISLAVLLVALFPANVGGCGTARAAHGTFRVPSTGTPAATRCSPAARP